MNDFQLAKDAFERGASLDEVRALCGVSRNKIIKLLKEAYGLERYKKIAKRNMIRRRVDAAIKSNTGRKHTPRSKEWCKKISDAKRGKSLTDKHKQQISATLKQRVREKGFWLSDEQIAQNAKKAREVRIANNSYETGAAKIRGKKRGPMPKSTRELMSKRKLDFYANGGKTWIEGVGHSQVTKDKLSRITTKMWEDGKFDSGNGLFRSKLEIRVFNYLLMHFKCKHSFRVGSRIFDIHIEDFNTLVEVNGDYWHYNPILYEGSYFDKSRDVYAEDVWNRDKEKEDIASKRGFVVLTVWENDLLADFESAVTKLVNTIKGGCPS